MRQVASAALLLGLLGCGASSSGSQARSAPAADERLSQHERAVPEASAAVREGEDQLAAGDAAAAKLSFSRALAENPNDARAALGLGIALELLEDWPAAESAYRRALAIDPAFAQAQNNLAVLLRDRGELREAMALLLEAEKQNPESAAVQKNLALTLEDQGDLDAARSRYERALALAPSDAMTRVNYGLLLLQTNDGDAARRELRRALGAAKGDRAALLAIGNGLRRAGDAQGALEAMQAAVQVDPSTATAALQSELALAQRAAGRTDEAIATLEQVLARHERYAPAHYLLGNMLAAAGKYLPAKKHYERYLSLEPKGEHAERARERLGVILKMK